MSLLYLTQAGLCAGINELKLVTMKLFLILAKVCFHGLVKIMPDIQNHDQTTPVNIYLFNINNKDTRAHMSAALVYL